MKFLYQAKSFKGEVKTGTLEAKDKHELARILRDQGFLLISASRQEKTEREGAQILNLDAFLGRIFGVSLVEKMMFARHLAVMIEAGLSLDRALRVLAEQTASSRFRDIILKIEEDVSKGKSFAESLSFHPREFNELFVNMVRVGEESGNLEEVLKVLARQMRKEHQLKSRVRGAMLYPAIILTAMFGIGILMMILVVPKLAEVFEELEIELPITTRTIILIGNFLANNTLLVLLGMPFVVLGIKFILGTKGGKYTMDWLILHSPMISGIAKKVNSARFARTLSSLIRSGVPIVKSLEILAGTLTNYYYKDSILKGSEQVKKGEDLNKSLKDFQNLYPPLVIQMIAVGEETGTLSDILSRLAIFYEGEVDTVTKNLSTVIEPILMIIIGSAVGFFAVSMIQPMYSMMNAL